jgi:hypothetical protein
MNDTLENEVEDKTREEVVVLQPVGMATKPDHASVRVEGEELPVLDMGEVSDGNHSFNALYEHRNLLFLALMKSQPRLSWFSQKHDNGGFWPGWFICGTTVWNSAVEHFTITYHMPIELLELARQTNASELPLAQPWDGHTSEDVLDRLRGWLSCI